MSLIAVSCVSPGKKVSGNREACPVVADARFDDFRMIFSDVAHLQQDMSVQALLAVWACVCSGFVP